MKRALAIALWLTATWLAYTSGKLVQARADDRALFVLDSLNALAPTARVMGTPRTVWGL